MEKYQAVFVYFGLLFTLFGAGLVWSRYRKEVVRRFNLREYHHNDEQPGQHHPV